MFSTGKGQLNTAAIGNSAAMDTAKRRQSRRPRFHFIGYCCVVEEEHRMRDQWSHDTPFEVRLHGHMVKFEMDVTRRLKATCRAFPDMLVSHNNFAYAVRLARSEILRLAVGSDGKEPRKV